ncbi:hypothetical protein EMIHUDRAFT_311863 [Emiliania huxleyi CCMP1516]|uniref:FHA domain-containing protein n=2 Tax=Emiliania huxleyi TaxID=2903 RepID=A0A0D3ID72_EMIH1|nr:hypothetical protein EMIHUDRAFT_311863 [Emiliania huxleyi CCMP1516]EOD09207.1 hypothetical protein EMIHUDRAFT_311863 [Emiliania huxleyi CCMP1516]|eukprot:XP_005761636.1 hypothetical protein EMIHUDRAFT_311863 [Emiliania huxleyi CCMP1516]
MAIGERPVTILGRHGGVADILLDDPSLSRMQAALYNSSSATFLADLDSAHGTWYDAAGRTHAVPQLGVRHHAPPRDSRDLSEIWPSCRCRSWACGSTTPRSRSSWPRARPSASARRRWSTASLAASL